MTNSGYYNRLSKICEAVVEQQSWGVSRFY